MDTVSRNLQVIRKGELKYALAAADSFIAEVVPGESFEVETELNIGGHLITRLDDALRIAFEEMVYWMEEGYGIAEPEAYMLLGQIAEARCTQMVNPKFTYICKVDKKYLPKKL
jgi:acetamidase/formamidase